MWRKTQTILQDAYKALCVERRLPYRVSIPLNRFLYAKQFDRVVSRVLLTPPLSCSQNADVELHMLTCSRDLLMAIVALKSLLRYSSGFAVIVHDDGTLTDADFVLLSSQVIGCIVVSTEDASSAARQSEGIEELRDALPERFQLHSSSMRRARALALKVFDFHLLANRKKLIVLDSDVLFLRKPTELIEWASGDGGEAIYATPYQSNLRVRAELLDLCFPRVPVISAFNSGLMAFGCDEVSLDRVREVVGRLMDFPNVPVYSDECVWRYLFSQVKAAPLSFDRYPLFGRVRRYRQFRSSKFVYAHFLMKFDGGVYAKLASQVINELICCDRVE